METQHIRKRKDGIYEMDFIAQPRLAQPPFKSLRQMRIEGIVFNDDKKDDEQETEGMLNFDDIRLIIFDIDGTIADRNSDQLYDHAKRFFRQGVQKHHWALATNQGGVGMRYWMTHDPENQWGNPEKYPTELAVMHRIGTLLDQIVPDGDDSHECAWYVCFAYQSRSSGEWSPIPPGKEADPSWQPENRKPAPGMLLQAMNEYSCQPHETLMVGNSPEDQDAALAAGVHYMQADVFFANAPKPSIF